MTGQMHISRAKSVGLCDGAQWSSGTLAPEAATGAAERCPTKKEHIARALNRIVMVSNDNAGTPGCEVMMGEWSSGTLAELPQALITALQNLFTEARDNLRNTEIARGEKTDSYQELKLAIIEKSIPALRACRKYLFAVLPQGRNDELLIEWGFEPWEAPTHHKPNDQKLLETGYDAATDIAKIRLEEDVLADEYIIETGKTPSPAPADWKPATWDVFATSDEPFFELGPLTEGFTFAFRGRARNSAGYGGYSEIWVVEVV